MKAGLPFAAVVMLMTAACGPGPGTHAKVRFRNHTPEGTGPAVFGMRLVSVALSGSGGTPVIYRNPDCDELAGCEAPAFFDFARENVNEGLGEHDRTIEAGSYDDVVLSLCSDGATPVVRWQAGAMTAPREFFADCVMSAALDHRFTVWAGYQLTVNLTYDASATLSSGLGAAGDDCDESASPRICFSLPAFEPRIDYEVVVE